MTVKIARIPAISAALLFTVLFSAKALAQVQPKPEDLAQQSSVTWLTLVDAGKYSQSWDEAAQSFKAAVTQAQWQAALTSVRTPQGKVLQRKLKSATYTKSLPNAPAGEYVVIQYDTDFERKQGATETVVPTLDKDGQWRVSGYFIK